MSAATAPRPLPPGREGKHGMPVCHAIFAPNFFRRHASKLTFTQFKAIGLIDELQGEEWLRLDRRLPRSDVFVEASPAKLAAWSGVTTREMTKVLAGLRELGGLRQQSLGKGRGCRYAVDWAKISEADPRPARTVVQSKAEKPETKGAPKPAALNCPLGHDCPVDSVVERKKDGVFVNISPPSNQQVTDGTSVLEFRGEEKAKQGTQEPDERPITRDGMVAWLHRTVPYDQVGEFLSAKLEAELWKYVSKMPAWVWQDAIRSKAAKARKWPFVLMLVVEAYKGYQRHGTTLSQPEPAPKPRRVVEEQMFRCVKCKKETYYPDSEGLCEPCGGDFEEAMRLHNERMTRGQP
jgi:hypothetical protein